MAAKKPKKESMWNKLSKKKSISTAEYYQLLNWVKIFIIGGILIGILVFFLVAVFGGLFKVASIIETANYYIYGLAFLAVLGSFLLAFVKWNYYLKKMGMKVPLLKNLIVYMSMFSMDLTPGRVGRIIVAYTLDRITDVKFVTIMPIVTTDIFTDFLGFALFTLIAAIWFNYSVLYIVILDILLMAPFIFFMNPWFYNKIKKHISGNAILSRFTIYGDEYFAAQSVLNKPKIYLVSLLVAIPEAFLLCSAFFLTLTSIGIKANLGKSTFVYSIAQLIGMAVPSSLGVTDGTLVALSGTILHYSAVVSSAATIMTRIATLWFGIFLGSAFLFYSLRYWKNKKTRSKSVHELKLTA
jgi:glycosyltransferase 2 family protein